MTTDHLDALREALATLDGITNEEWLETLDVRKREELEFHDRDRDREAVRDARTIEEFQGNRKYYAVVEGSRRYVSDWIRAHAPSRVVLDYACGNGSYTIEAARAGASLAIGLDLSRTSVENARKDADRASVASSTHFVQGDCENTRLPDECVDVVICSGMLHHLDLSYAFPELRRIMKPGAVLLAIEALNVNPVIKLYRLLTPKMRTAWEAKHILSHRDLQFAKRFFDVHNVRYWHLFVIPTALLRQTPIYRPAFVAAELVDRLAMRVPLVQRMAWMFTFELHKPG